MTEGLREAERVCETVRDNEYERERVRERERARGRTSAREPLSDGQNERVSERDNK